MADNVPGETLVDRELARVTARLDGEDASQRQQDAWLARRYQTMIGAGMDPQHAADMVSEYQGYLWGTADVTLSLEVDRDATE